jgi:hypothetical protein
MQDPIQNSHVLGEVATQMRQVAKRLGGMLEGFHQPRGSVDGACLQRSLNEVCWPHVIHVDLFSESHGQRLQSTDGAVVLLVGVLFPD